MYNCIFPVRKKLLVSVPSTLEEFPVRDERRKHLFKKEGPLNEVGDRHCSRSGCGSDEDGELCKMSRFRPESHRVPELPPGSVQKILKNKQTKFVWNFYFLMKKTTPEFLPMMRSLY